MRLISVDVDGVVVDTHSLYREASKHLEDPLDFWRAEDLYDNLIPMEGAVEKLERLSQYFGIVFISRLKGNHHKSKVGFCKKYFPFMAGFIGTHEKWLMKESVVAMIDDLESNLVNFYPQQRILFGGEGLKDWSEFDVKQFCKEYL